MSSTEVNDIPERDHAVELAARVHSGDSRAEEELLRHYQPGVMRILVRATADFELARDLCQDTLRIVLVRLRSGPLEEPSKLLPFIAQTARNLAIAARRKTSRRRTEADTDAVEAVEDPGPATVAAQQAESMANVIRRLLGEMKAPRDRAVLIRYYLHEEDKSDICKDLGLTDLQFNQVLFRARNRFRDLLEKRGVGRHDLLMLCLA